MYNKFYRYEKYHTSCVVCGRKTTKQHARENGGQCASCVEPQSSTPTREQRVLEVGYQAYAREESHFD